MELIVKTVERIIKVKMFDYEKSIDLMYQSEFKFISGKTYGIIGEHGSGAWALSCLLSGNVNLIKEIIHMDGKNILNEDIQNIGWYLGDIPKIKTVFNTEKEIGYYLKKAVKYNVNKYLFDDICEKFHLSKKILNCKLTNLGGERWRALTAIGYAYRKIIYCFPWFDTSYLCDVIVNSGLNLYANYIKEAGGIIIIPTSKAENLKGIADDYIILNNPRFSRKWYEHEGMISNK